METGGNIAITGGVHQALTHTIGRLEPGTNNTRVMTVLFYDHIGIMTRDDVVDSRLQSPMLAETRCCVLKCVGMRSPD